MLLHAYIDPSWKRQGAICPIDYGVGFLEPWNSKDNIHVRKVEYMQVFDLAGPFPNPSDCVVANAVSHYLASICRSERCALHARFHFDSSCR